MAHWKDTQAENKEKGKEKCLRPTGDLSADLAIAVELLLQLKESVYRLIALVEEGYSTEEEEPYEEEEM